MDLYLIPHPQLDDRGGKRLPYVIHGAQRQPFFLACHIRQPRDKYNRDILCLFGTFKRGNHFVSVHIRHFYVEQYHIGQIFLRGDQGVLSVSGRENIIVRPESPAKLRNVHHLIVYDEYTVLSFIHETPLLIYMFVCMTRCSPPERISQNPSKPL
jgi:hypothetical protein